MLKSHLEIKKKVSDSKERVFNVQLDAVGSTTGVRQSPISINEEEQVQKPKKRELTCEEISMRLGFLGKTAVGDGYAYLKTTCAGMNLTEISAVQQFKYLQYVDVSNNDLDLDALQAVTKLPFLIYIQADSNLLHSAALNTAKYIQVIIMNKNSISTVDDVYQPELSTLEVGYNKIKKIFFNKKMPYIKCLDFRYNLIEEINNLDFLSLDSLYLAGNKIRSFVGVERLVNLRILHARFNPIKLLDGFDKNNKKLMYINLRNCLIATLTQVRKLRVLSNLETLVIKGCPFMGGTGVEGTINQEEEDGDLRVDVVAALPRLKRLNKENISYRERTEAHDLMNQWIEEGEKDEEEIEAEQPEDDLGN